ncbi:MAG: class I SAM-dependent methyltransferase [Dehalococcoidia bacterium]
MGSSMNTEFLDLQPVGACCSIIYSHPLATWLIGESFHPGGLALTDELASLTDLGPGMRLLDAGCGRGASTVHLAESTGCEAVGLTLESDGVERGTSLAEATGVSDRVQFVQDDILHMDTVVGEFDVVLMECVLSTLEQKPESLRQLYRITKPGGFIALTDVTVSAELPDSLKGSIGAALCMADARDLDEYMSLVEEAGFKVKEYRSAKEAVHQLIKKIGTRLMIADAAIGLGSLNVDRSLIVDAREALKTASKLVDKGTLGYGLFVAQRMG